MGFFVGLVSSFLEGVLRKKGYSINFFFKKGYEKMSSSYYPEIEKELVLLEEFIQKNIRSRNRLLNEAVSSIVKSGGKET